MSGLKINLRNIFLLASYLCIMNLSLFGEHKKGVSFENLVYSSGTFKYSTWEKSKEIFLYTDDVSKKVNPRDAFVFNNSDELKLKIYEWVQGGRNLFELDGFVYFKNEFGFNLKMERIAGPYKICGNFGNLKFSARASAAKGGSVGMGSSLGENSGTEKSVTVTGPQKTGYSKNLSFRAGIKPLSNSKFKLPFADIYGTFLGEGEFLAGANFVYPITGFVFPVMYLGASARYEKNLNVEFFAETYTPFWTSSNSFAIKNVLDWTDCDWNFKSLNNFKFGRLNLKSNLSFSQSKINWFVSGQSYCLLNENYWGGSRLKFLYGAGIYGNGQQEKIRLDGKLLWGKNSFALSGIQNIQESKNDVSISAKMNLHSGKFSHSINASGKFAQDDYSFKGSYKLNKSGTLKTGFGTGWEIQLKRKDFLEDWQVADWCVKNSFFAAWKWMKFSVEFELLD